MNLPVALGFFDSPAAVVALVGAVACLSAVSAVLPLRGGNGQHAHAGPGAVSVWQISQAVAAERHNKDDYAGKHRRLEYDAIVQPLLNGKVTLDLLAFPCVQGERAV